MNKSELIASMAEKSKLTKKDAEVALKAFIESVEEALEKRELIKIKVLENSGLETREASDYICEKIKAEGIQAIGSKIVLYKKSKKNPKIEIPVVKKK